MSSLISPTLWTTLLPAALAGTRCIPTAAGLPGLTPSLGAEADALEKQLLLTAANLALVQRASQRPQPGPAEALPPPLPEAWPEAPDTAFARLEPLLADFPPEEGSVWKEPCQQALQGVLAELQQLGRRLPARFVLPLLRLPFGHDYPYAKVRQVLGERGHWLHPLLPGNDSSWYGNLLRVEGNDTPYLSLARRILWPRAADTPVQLPDSAVLSAQERTRLLWEAWRYNGGHTLPQFLQAELDALLAATPPEQRPWPSEIRGVQQRVAGHPRMSGHPTLTRLAESAGRLLTLEQAAGPLPHVQVALPTGWQDDWKKAGLWRTPNYFRRRNEREIWLQELLYLLGPRHWAEVWQRPPAEVVALVAAAERGTLVLEAWSNSLTTTWPGYQPEPDFARALLAAAPLTSLHERAALVQHLPVAEQAAWLASILPPDPAAPHEHEWAEVLAHRLPLLRQPQLLRQVLTALAGALAQPRSSGGAKLTLLLKALNQLRPDAELSAMVRAALGAVAPTQPGLARLLDVLLHGLALRHDLRQTCAASNATLAPRCPPAC